MEVIYFFKVSPLPWSYIYNKTLKNGMFYISDGSWQSKAKIDCIQIDTFYFCDYSVTYCIIDSSEIYVKWMEYIGWREVK